MALDGLLGYVPVAAFAALIAPGLSLGTPEMLPRLFRVAIAAVVVLRIGHLWAGLGAGMASYWTASALAAGLVPTTSARRSMAFGGGSRRSVPSKDRLDSAYGALWR